jgi:O-antigen/teichoic acid export membrane protein
MENDVNLEKHTGLLKSDHDLNSKTARASLITVASQVLGLVIQVVGTVILARLLTPHDVGLVTMVTTFSLLLVTFTLNGFTEAIIQREELTHEMLSTLFWINLCFGLVLSLVLLLLTIFLASFLKQPEIRLIGLAVSCSIGIGSIGSQHLALLRRNMHFFAFNANNIIAKLVSTSMAIVCALTGWGYWALVINLLLFPSLMSFGSWFWCSWRPGWPCKNSGAWEVVRFTLHSNGSYCVGYVSRNLDKFLLGWWSGSAILGNYKRAYDLFSLPLDMTSAPLTAVALSALSRLRGNPARFMKYYLHAVSLLSFVGMALGFALTVLGRDFLRVLLGSQWDEAGRIFTCFAPAIGIMLVYWTNAWLHLSLGHADRWLRWCIVEMVACSCLFVIGLKLGPRGVALSWTVAACALIWPGLAYAGKPIGLSFRAIWGAMWKYAISGFAAGLISWFLLSKFIPIMESYDWKASFARLSYGSVLFMLIYTGILLLFPMKTTLGPMWEVMKIMIFRKAPPLAPQSIDSSSAV